MNPDSVIKCFDILKYEPICVLVIENAEPVEPLSFYKGMEGVDTGVIVRIFCFLQTLFCKKGLQKTSG